MPAEAAAGKRILIIEDDTSVRRLMAKHFRRSGHTVLEAEDAAGALSHLPVKGAAFDLVLTDVHLPDSSGVDLARLLHERSPESPLIFVTGDPDEALAREALEVQGAAGYLVKPFRLFELDEVVNRVLGGTPSAPAPAPEPPARTNRIAHLLDDLKVDGPSDSAHIDAAAAEAAAALDTGDAYEVVEPRWPVRLLPEPSVTLFPRPHLNLRQGAVLLLLLALALLLSNILPGSRFLNGGQSVPVPAATSPDGR